MTSELDPHALKAAAPRMSGAVTLAALEGDVEILRDTYGVPHVRAGSLHDAFLAQGFVTAQDRLWQMECDRRRAYGRWAELVGASGVATDKSARRVNLGASARADYGAFDRETRVAFDAYAAGVNAFIESTDVLPIEYAIVGARPERWQPWDSCAVYKVRHLLMGTHQYKLWRACALRTLGPEVASHMVSDSWGTEVLIIPPGEEYVSAVDRLSELEPGADALPQLPEIDGGSNNWALLGGRTASGKPLVAGDPHRALEVPNVYYQNHIACPDFDVIGLSLAGVPGFPHFGHNERVAWCITHGMVDDQDVFIERFAPGDPGRYEFRGEWRRAERRVETIRVSGADPVELEVTATHHGPIIIGEPRHGTAVALRWTATAGVNRGLTALVPMLRASNVHEFNECMRPWVEPCNNLIAADADGNISYLLRGQVPIRSMANAWLPVPGWTGEHEWQGAVPFEKLPRITNPDTGYLVTANNRVVGSDYPYYVSLTFDGPSRARRIIERIESLRRASAEDMASIHADQVSLPSRLFVQHVDGVRPAEPLAREILDRLRAWNGEMKVDSVGATVYAVLRAELTGLVGERSGLAGIRADPLNSGLGLTMALSRILHGFVRRNDTGLLGRDGATWSEAFDEAFGRAVDWLRENHGPDIEKWRWGELHRTLFMHRLSWSHPNLAKSLNPPDVELGGDGDTVLSGVMVPGLGYRILAGSVARYVFDLADWDNSAWIVPLGVSAHAGSPHYADQLGKWSEVKLVPMLYSWDSIARDAETRQQLVAQLR